MNPVLENPKIQLPYFEDSCPWKWEDINTCVLDKISNEIDKTEQEIKELYIKPEEKKKEQSEEKNIDKLKQMKRELDLAFEYLLAVLDD